MIDILIIGSGGTGLTAALEAKKKGKKIAVLSKTYPVSSQTSQAQGGINGVLENNHDTIENHINDTLRSAHEIGSPETIKYMCENAGETIQWLDEIGVPFSRNENNNIAQRSLGGASNPRACYSSDYTGLKILHTLYDNCIKEDIEFINEHILLNLIVEDETVKGVTSLNIINSEIKQINAKSVLLASGGYAGIYNGFNTNSTATTGDGVAAALRAGCKLSNMEYIQFHPTSLKESCILISESARGEGGYLVTANGERFIDELAPRDVVARAIYSKIEKGEEVFLDLRHLGIEKIKQVMPQEYDLALQFSGLKMDQDLIPIIPAAHYTMGGIKTDINGKTNIKNLYAAGECACNGVHGANRLGGNSLLEIITFGKRTASYMCQNLEDTAIDKKNNSQLQKEKEYIEKLYKKEPKKDFYKIKNLMGKLFYKNIGLFREEEGLKQALQQVSQWENDLDLLGIEDKNRTYNTNLKEFLEFKNMLELAPVIIKSAIDRKESRGAHYRNDYEKENNDYEKETIAVKDQNNIIFDSYKDI